MDVPRCFRNCINMLDSRKSRFLAFATVRVGCRQNCRQQASAARIVPTASSECRRPVYLKPRMSDPAEGAKAAIDRNHDAVYEVGCWAAQPNQGADKFLGLAKTAGGGMVDYRSASLREAPILVQQEMSVLLSNEKAGCNGVDPQACAMLSGQFHREPTGEVLNGGLSCGVTNYVGEGP